MAKYDEFVSRNAGYISEEVQAKIKETHLLIAGCGIGSQIAVAAVRMGFRKFTLIDGDEVSLTNLNRQAFYHDQIGKNKSAALAENMKRINPDIEVKVHEGNFDASQMSIMEGVDLVLDTIDFLDLKAILTLHEVAEHFKIPLISGMSAGWGACSIYFPNQKGAQNQFRNIFGINDQDSGHPMSYVIKFAALFDRIKDYIDPQVTHVMQDTFKKLMDNKPCPAPQVIGGSYCLASLMCNILGHILGGEFLSEAPYLIAVDMNNVIRTSVVDISSREKIAS